MTIDLIRMTNIYTGRLMNSGYIWEGRVGRVEYSYVFCGGVLGGVFDEKVHPLFP